MPVMHRRFSDWIEKYSSQFTTCYGSESNRGVVGSERGGPSRRDRLSQVFGKYRQPIDVSGLTLIGTKT